MSVKSIKKGAIILARPSLSLDIFSRSMVIIADHSDQGSLGFILNKPCNLPINLFITQVESNHIVYQGGPVQQENIYFLHRRPDLIKNSARINENIYWSGEFSDLIQAIQNQLIKENDIKFCLGYCGWSENQLQDEILRKEWEIIEDLQVNILDHWENDLWKNSLQKLGGENLIWLNTPFDPFMN